MHKVGWHLNNKDGPSDGEWAIMDKVKPSAVLAMPGPGGHADIVKRVLAINPKCHIFVRLYFPPSADTLAYMQYTQNILDMLPHWDFVPPEQRHAHLYNEPNMPRHSQWEGFGDHPDDMLRFNKWFCYAYDKIKAVHPTWKIGFTPLTPGNRDVFFPDSPDPQGVPYYMHGPEAAKPNPTPAEIAAAIKSGPCFEALSKADEYMAHIYVINDPFVQMKQQAIGLRFLQYARFFPKPMDIWITEVGMGYPAHSWDAWYKLLDEYPQVKSTCIWILGQDYRSPDDARVNVLENYLKHRTEPAPAPPPPPPVVEPPIEAMRHMAYNAAGIAYNPDAALVKEARARDLGAPLTGELPCTAHAGTVTVTYRFQAFVGGILYCKVGDWANIKFFTW